MRRIGVFLLMIGFGGFLCGSAQGQPASGPSGPQPQIVPPPATQQPPPVDPFGPQPRPSLDNFLAFDAELKEVKVTNGTPQAHFTFNLTNISSGDVTINSVKTSCHCTVADLPSTPWKLAPKESGQISATMDLVGTPVGGSKTKTLTVSTDKGPMALYAKATVLPGEMSEMDRTNAQKVALADRQAVFRGDCASCHVTTGKDSAGHDKLGKDLYASVCGICHEAEHQASFVPNLHKLPEPTNPVFWKNWIAHGKPGTLMPAFAQGEGGFLTDTQIESLVAYLTMTIPPHPAAATTSAK